LKQDSEALNLEQILGALRRRLPLIVLCVAAVAGAAYGYSKQETKKYTATASVAFSNNSLSQQIAGLPASSNSSSSLLAQEASNVELVKGSDAAATTATLLGQGLTAEQVAGSLSVAGQGESQVVTISATTTSPTLSAAIANTYAQQFGKEQQRSQLHYYRSALAIVHKQLAALSPRERAGSGGVELEDRAQTLSLLSELKEGNVKATAEAPVPTTPSSPKTSRNTALGLFLGLLIGLSLAFVLERLDRRIRAPEDLEAAYRLPLLGAIPKSAALSRSARAKGDGKRAVLPSAEAEAFSLIRARLRFFNVDRDLRTVVIASAAPGDGKTTLARHLAEAAARLGSRVLLLEADLRHPTLAQQFDLRPGPGLADVLIGAAPIGEATQPVELRGPPGERATGRTLDVLAAGAVLPPNPGELTESRAMDAVLEQTKSAYDLVVIDTPPLAAVSDAFSLLTKVDGVVIVGRMGHSRRDAAEQLHQVLAGSGAPVLGVVANGSSGPGISAYAKHDKSLPVTASANGASSSEQFVPFAKA
jgi:polysaccharide biosynthesis transport protein